jgi:hypothetical protein
MTDGTTPLGTCACTTPLQTPLQRHYNAITMPLQTPLQRHYNAITTPLQCHYKRHYNAIWLFVHGIDKGEGRKPRLLTAT